MFHPSMVSRGIHRLLRVAASVRNGFTKSLALEVAKAGVTVNTISPGYIGTKMVMAIPVKSSNPRSCRIPVSRLGKPEEIAGLVAHSTHHEAAS